MNPIGTSINITKERLGRLQNTASLLNISETEILSLLIEKSRRHFDNKAVTRKTVEYQRGSSPDFVIHHVVFTDIDYEFAAGRRYLFKISVSFLIGLSIDLYLSEIIREWLISPSTAAARRENYTTNFHYLHFDIYHLDDIGSELWLIPWPKE